jgi:hypothetical protein
MVVGFSPIVHPAVMCEHFLRLFVAHPLKSGKGWGSHHL